MEADNSRVIPMTSDHQIDAFPRIRMGRTMPELPIDFAGPEPVQLAGFESGTLNAVCAPVKSLADKYPKYYKRTNGAHSIDVYAVHQMFDVQDPSGAIQHASKKLLLSGVRTGGKSKAEDIKEARDTLTRWLQLNAPELS